MLMLVGILEQAVRDLGMISRSGGIFAGPPRKPVGWSRIPWRRGSARTPGCSCPAFRKPCREALLMFERFTDRARQTMALANHEAQRLGHEYIGTEHILLGLVKEGTGTAARVLRDLGVEPRRLREEVEKLFRSEPHAVRTGKLPITPVAKQALQYAVEEARALRHDYVGTEHLLLGVLRDHNVVAAVALNGLGLKMEAIREAVLRMIGADPGAAPPEHGGPGRSPPRPGPLRPEWLLQRAGIGVPT